MSPPPPLQTSASFNYYYMNGKEDMDARLKQVKVICGVWGDAQRTASMVLHPCGVEFSRHRDGVNAPVVMNVKVHVYLCSTVLCAERRCCCRHDVIYMYW